MNRTSIRTATVVVVASIAVAWPIFWHGGIPVLHHDWSWPADAAQARAQALIAISTTIPDNFGSLNFYQNNAAFWAISALLETLFGPELALRILVGTIVAGAGLALFAFLRVEFAMARVTSAAAGTFYATNAIVANRLAAGHLTYLFAYAVFPIVVWQLIRIARSADLGPWIALVAISPLAIVHPQFMVFPFMAALALLPFAPQRRRSWLMLAAALPLVLVPYTVAVALTGSPANDLSFERTTLQWEKVNSASLLNALVLSNGSYDRLAPPVLLFVEYVAIIGIWLLAILGAIRDVRMRPLFVIAIFGLVMQWGLNGPLGGPLAYAFTHFLATSLFRELYHFAVFSALGVILCASAAFPRTPLPIVALTVCAALPQLTGAYFHGIDFEHDRDISTISQIIGGDRRPGYVAFLPMLQPLGPDPSRAGDDPQAFAFPGHATIHEFMPQSPMVQIDLALRRHPEDAAMTLRAYGIRYVVIRPTWSSFYETSQEPSLRALLAEHPALPQRIPSVVATLNVIWRGEHTVLARISDSEGPIHGPPFSTLRRFPIGSYSIDTPLVTNPHDGWVDALRWFWWLPENAIGSPLGILTASDIPLHFVAHDTKPILYAWRARGARIATGRGTAPLSSDGVRGTTIVRGRGILKANVNDTTGFIGIGSTVAVRPSGIARKRCRSCTSSRIEIVYNRALGYAAHVDGKVLASDPTAWDERVDLNGRHALVRSALLAFMARIESLQYLSWILSISCGTYGIILYVSRMRRRAS